MTTPHGPLTHGGVYPARPRYTPRVPGLHMPMQPSWQCTGCGTAWPCETTKLRLLVEYEGSKTTLGLLMAMRHADAAGDLRDVPAGELYERFLGWVRRSPGSATEPGS